MPKQRFGDMLKAMREAQGLTQVQLANRARVTQSYIAEIEGGMKKNPSFEVLKNLAKALKVSVAELVK